MPNVEVPGVGVVAFPDSMSEQQIQAAIAEQSAPPAAGSGRIPIGPFDIPVEQAAGLARMSAGTIPLLLGGAGAALGARGGPKGMAALGSAGAGIGEKLRQDLLRAALGEEPEYMFGPRGDVAFNAILGAIPGGAEGARLAAPAAARKVGEIASLPFLRRLPLARMLRGFGADAAEVAGRGAPTAVPEAAGAARVVRPGVEAGEAIGPRVTQAGVPAAEQATEAGVSRGTSAAVEAGEGAAKAVPEGFHEVKAPFLRKNPVRAKPTRPVRGEAKKLPEASARRAKESAKLAKGEPLFSVKNPQTGKFEIIRGGKPVPKAEAPAAAPKATRHSVQYYSESKGKYVDIEGMNQKHVESAIRKLAAKNPKPGSVGKQVLDALLAESKHRLTTTGIHIGQ